MKIKNTRVLLASGEFRRTSLTMEDGVIAEIGKSASCTPEIDGRGLLLLPGIVDLHGDGFERHVMPRPGVSFGRALGLLDTDRTMAANGITTAFHGLTYSWEPGLRGRQGALDFLCDLEQVRPLLGCDTRLHLRFETYNLPALDEVDGWLRSGRVDLLGFNDHMDHMIAHQRENRMDKIATYMERTGLSREAFMALVDEIKARQDDVPAGIERLAATAREQKLPMASHDDPDPETCERYKGLGCKITEFPLTGSAARQARDLGNAVVLGAPNALRNKSHVGGVLAREAIAEGLCDVLTSDYFYPSLLQAPFALERAGTCPLGRAWALVSTNPARAVGLDDRGVIQPGKRADLVLVDDSNPELPFAVMSFSRGRPIFSANGLGL